MTKFLVDRMLGQIVKWLRLLGVDAEYAPKGDDKTLKDIAEKEDRIILTRDKELSRSEYALYIEERDIDLILNKILERYDIDIEPLTRCSLCNSKIESIDKKEIEKDVPEGVYKRNEEFWICNKCGQIYWKGSHWDKIMAKIEKLKN